MANGRCSRRRRGWIRPVVVIIFRLSCLVLLLALAACISTPTPTYKTHNSKPVLRYVRANDTLYSIGKKFGIDYRLIAKRNHIRYPYKIYLGQRLYIDRHAPRRNDLTAIKIKNASKKSHKKASKKTIKRKTHQKKVNWPLV